MQFTLADLHHYVRPEDRQLLDVIEMRAAERKAAEIETLVRNCMARKPPEPEQAKPRMLLSDDAIAEALNQMCGPAAYHRINGQG